MKKIKIALMLSTSILTSMYTCVAHASSTTSFNRMSQANAFCAMAQHRCLSIVQSLGVVVQYELVIDPDAGPGRGDGDGGP